eukprot:6949871-Alexandrium_andersonii.AAC.1
MLGDARARVFGVAELLKAAGAQAALAACHEELEPWGRREVVLDSLGVWVLGHAGQARSSRAMHSRAGALGSFIPGPPTASPT